MFGTLVGSVKNRIFAAASTVALTCAPGVLPEALAADFSQAKKTYVPPTSIDRRIDFTALREHQAVQYKSAPIASSHSVSSPARFSSSSSGIVPPPPPYSSSLVSNARAARTQLKKLASSPQAQAALTSMKNRAAELVRAGKFDEAKMMAARALQMSPQDKQVLKQMGNAGLDRAKQFLNNGEFDKALQYARQSLAYDGSNPDAKRTVDQLLTKAGLNPDSAEQRLKNADLLASQGRTEEAFVEYQASLRLKPSADAHIGVGNIALRSGQKEQAKQQYQSAIELDPASSAAYRQLGLLKYSGGDVVGANAALSRALVLNPKDKHASKSLIELWQHQVSKVPSANSHLGLARAYQLSGDLQSAQAQYRTVVRLDPENPHLPAARQAFKLALSRQEAERAAQAARTLETHGAINDAYEKIHEAVKLSPGDASLRVHQGQLLEKLSKYNSAREAYLNALKIDPRNGIAAERLKSLPGEDRFAAGSLSMPPSQTLAAPPAVATNGTLTPGMPAPSHDPVSNISNFATQLRDQILTQKTQIQQVEDVAQKVISQIGKQQTSEALVTASGPTATAAAVTAGTAAAESAADSAGSSAADAIAAAAQAIAAAKGGGTPATTSAAATSAPASGTATGTAAAAPAAEPATPSISDTLLKPFPKATSALKQMQALKQQNDQLRQQLEKMQQSIRQMKGVPTGAAGEGPAADASALGISTPIATAAQAAALPPQMQNAPPLAPPLATSFAQQTAPLMTPLQAEMPLLDPSALGVPSSVAQQMVPLRQPIAVGTPVRLELEGVNTKLGGVELAVVLRNDGDVPLILPPKVRAVINYSNRRPAEVKPVFADSAVPARGAIRGVIRVPYDKVDPTADLVIPGLLPEGSRQRDIHLITSMASR